MYENKKHPYDVDEEKLEGSEIGFTSGKSKFSRWLDNFLYHYKWHTIIALFVVFAIVVCSVQIFSRTNYDAYIMYAGGKEIKKTAQSGSSDYEKMLSAMKQYVSDFDEDGAKNLSLLNLFIPSPEEIAKVEAEKQETGLEVNYTLISQDSDTLEQYMVYGEFYLCFMSEYLFMQYDNTADGLILFANVEKYTNGNFDDYEFASERGIYLRSTALYSKAGFCELPEDTVIALRAFSEVASNVGKKKNVQIYKNSESILEELLKDG